MGDRLVPTQVLGGNGFALNSPALDGKSLYHAIGGFVFMNVKAPVSPALHRAGSSRTAVDDRLVRSGGAANGNRLAAQLDVTVARPFVDARGHLDNLAIRRGVNGLLDSLEIARNTNRRRGCVQMHFEIVDHNVHPQESDVATALHRTNGDTVVAHTQRIRGGPVSSILRKRVKQIPVCRQGLGVVLHRRCNVQLEHTADRSDAVFIRRQHWKDVVQVCGLSHVTDELESGRRSAHGTGIMQVGFRRRKDPLGPED